MSLPWTPLLPPLHFPQEWWNATTVGEYWRLWNQPVHKWMLRHVYFPLIRHGVPKFYAGAAVLGWKGPSCTALTAARALPGPAVAHRGLRCRGLGRSAAVNVSAAPAPPGHPPTPPVPPLSPGFAVFFVSAVFHEVLVGVPLHMLRLWAFWGLMAQVPLMMVTEWLKGALRSDRVGNVVFWVSFVVVGQPLAMILYYHDYRTGASTPFS